MHFSDYIHKAKCFFWGGGGSSNKFYVYGLTFQSCISSVFAYALVVIGGAYSSAVGWTLLDHIEHISFIWSLRAYCICAVICFQRGRCVFVIQPSLFMVASEILLGFSAASAEFTYTTLIL